MLARFRRRSRAGARTPPTSSNRPNRPSDTRNTRRRTPSTRRRRRSARPAGDRAGAAVPRRSGAWARAIRLAAEGFFERVLKIDPKRAAGRTRPELAATMRRRRRTRPDAESQLYKQALAVENPNSLEAADTLRKYSMLLRRQGRLRGGRPRWSSRPREAQRRHDAATCRPAGSAGQASIASAAASRRRRWSRNRSRNTRKKRARARSRAHVMLSVDIGPDGVARNFRGDPQPGARARPEGHRSRPAVAVQAGDEGWRAGDRQSYHRSELPVDVGASPMLEFTMLASAALKGHRRAGRGKPDRVDAAQAFGRRAAPGMDGGRGGAPGAADSLLDAAGFAGAGEVQPGAMAVFQVFSSAGRRRRRDVARGRRHLRIARRGRRLARSTSRTGHRRDLGGRRVLRTAPDVVRLRGTAPVAARRAAARLRRTPQALGIRSSG